MRKQITKTTMPFAVSMTLIFGYSMFKAAVPPTVVGFGDVAEPAADSPDAQAAPEPITQVSAESTPAGSTARSFQ